MKELLIISLLMIFQNCGNRSAEKDYERVHAYISSCTLPPAQYKAGSIIRIFPEDEITKKSSDIVWVIHEYQIEIPNKYSQHLIDTFVVPKYGIVIKIRDLSKE